ncbi:hypothetical protein DRE_03271 [Drechslerella stenobrocha 248]|uniref:Uncharacterized protein n=1 Tax=Drechslerella stenobrocha 248 TaxID=1043628 RepID=W7HU03_9PEZI|nr:hypothetical protein DRE_03271 [Drechslerella stenobrocha 248]
MCNAEESIISRFCRFWRKLSTGGEVKPSKLAPEQQALLEVRFSPRIRSIFSEPHLAEFLPTETQEKSVTCLDDLVICRAMKPSSHERFGKIYDSGKLGRCLKELGMTVQFVAGYLRWKRESQFGTTFDGCGWNEEWVYDIGGTRGAVQDVFENF